MAVDFKEYVIGEIAQVIGGSTPSTTDDSNFGGDIPWLTPKDLSGDHERYIKRGERNLTKKGLASCSAQILPKNSVLLSSRAPIGYLAIAANPIATNQGFRSLILKPGFDHEFVYYWLLENKEELERHSTGSTFKELSGSALKGIKIAAPPLPEQRAIAHILGTLDDKIELNRKMNETLEAMARALFKSWFVDFDPVRAKAEGRDTGLPKEITGLFPDEFEDSELGEIPKGWENTLLDDLVEKTLGGDWGVDEATPERNSMVFCVRGADIPDLQSGGRGNMPLRYIKTSSLEKRMLKEGDLVIEISGGSPTQSTGRTIIVKKELLQRLDVALICSNFCRAIRPKDNLYSNFMYLLLRFLYKNNEFFQYENGSTGIKNFAFSAFSSSYKFGLPSQPLLIKFNAQVAQQLERLQRNAAQNVTLAALRDVLLPKLISGELRVPEAERLVEQEAFV
jgi:type I restriction enzyme S subunit